MQHHAHDSGEGDEQNGVELFQGGVAHGHKDHHGQDEGGPVDGDDVTQGDQHGHGHRQSGGGNEGGGGGAQAIEHGIHRFGLAEFFQEAKEMAMQMMSDIPDTMYVLTNDTKVNGAAAILNDDIRQEIAEKVGDFYMLPSSIHETLIIPKDAGMEFKELEQMVQEVNQTQVAPGERLSDHVYEYDAKEHELFRSDRAEERAKQKEEKGDNRHERVSVKEKLAEKKDAVIKMNAGKEHSAPEKKKEAVI